jgi:outer membrane lipoprotein-sorting protein
MKYMLFLISLFCATAVMAQDEEALLKKVRAKLEKVADYQAEGKMKLDVSFINAPASKVTVFYKKPNRFKVKKAGGISILPKGGVSVNVNTLITGGS